MADTNTTWKQVVYDAADAYRTASATTANVKVGELAQKISTLEDVTAEVTTQTPLIEDIIEALETKGITPTNGIYIWQRTSENTTEYVVSDDPQAYPDDGEQGGFTYKKIQTTETTEITPGTTDQTISALSLLLNTLTVKGDADLVANNIRSGVDIFGVIGTMVQGRTDIAWGTVTLSSRQSSITVNHKLGVIPSYKAIFAVNGSWDGVASDIFAQLGEVDRYIYSVSYNGRSGIVKETYGTGTATTTQVSFNSLGITGDLSRFPLGCTFVWVAIAS